MALVHQLRGEGVNPVEGPQIFSQVRDVVAAHVGERPRILRHQVTLGIAPEDTILGRKLVVDASVDLVVIALERNVADIVPLRVAGIVGLRVKGNAFCVTGLIRVEGMTFPGKGSRIKPVPLGSGRRVLGS